MANKTELRQGLTVNGFTIQSAAPGRSGKAYWNVLCPHGQSKEVRGTHFRDGKVRCKCTDQDSGSVPVSVTDQNPASVSVQALATSVSDLSTQLSGLVTRLAGLEQAVSEVLTRPVVSMGSADHSTDPMVSQPGLADSDLEAVYDAIGANQRTCVALVTALKAEIKADLKALEPRLAVPKRVKLTVQAVTRETGLSLHARLQALAKSMERAAELASRPRTPDEREELLDRLRIEADEMTKEPDPGRATDRSMEYQRLMKLI